MSRKSGSKSVREEEVQRSAKKQCFDLLKRVVLAIVNGDFAYLLWLAENIQHFEWNQVLTFWIDAKTFKLLSVESKTGQTIVDIDVDDVEGRQTAKAKANVSSVAAAVLCQCEKPSSLEILKFLLNDSKVCVDGIDDDDVQMTALLIAARYGHVEVVRLLLSNSRVDVNKAADDGAAPLLIAARYGHVEIVSRLLSNSRVDVNKADNDGLTPLDVAARRGHAEVVKLLAARSDVLQDYVRLSMDWSLSAAVAQRTTAKLGVLLNFQHRMHRALQEAGGESLLSRCHKFMLVNRRVDQSQVPRPSIEMCRRRDVAFIAKLTIGQQDMETLNVIALKNCNAKTPSTRCRATR
jgi:Ankyrin repeats (3 copies)/Ankyrin repeats (many copies)